MKTCSACKTEKPLEEFHRSSSSRDGRQYRCKECAIAAARQRAIANPEAKRAADRKYSASDRSKANRKARREGPQRDVILTQKQQSYYRNHEANLERMRARAAQPENKARARERYAKWRATNPRGARAWWLRYYYGITLEQWDDMVLAQEGRCAVCSL